MRQEEGFGLVEVLVSAVLLALVAVGVLAGIDGPSAVSADNKSRSVASALADQEQERMRSLKFSDLESYDSTRAVTEGDVPYTIHGYVSWVSDKSGTDSCTSNSTNLDYLKATATVTWPGLTSGNPVTTTSIVSPPASVLGGNLGGLVAQVQEQAGNPVTGLPVSITPGSVSHSTNAYGCAMFPYLQAGNYSATYSQAGWVDPSGNTAVSLSGSVTALATTTLTGLYAQAAKITVGVDTLPSGASSPTPATTQAVSVANPGIPAPGTRTFTAPAAQPTIDATNLFPFTSGYGVYSGSCSANNPVTYNPSYWSSGAGFVTTSPGQTYTVTVREPAINVTVKRNALPLANAHVVVKATAPGCSDRYVFTTSAQGQLTNQGVPFGTYSVCADDGARSAANLAVTATSATGSAPFTLNVPTSGMRSVCS
ncbi:MAG: prepilin-type N-terminal cleavage/methylation domain-containing protein [Actinobacteria bacterium]|nr:prepilin-type N-terminal cleavage/methylation domain-containing protein [Actinomycetota bacterium]